MGQEESSDGYPPRTVPANLPAYNAVDPYRLTSSRIRHSNDEVMAVTFKCTVVGDKAIGKSALVVRFTDGSFESDPSKYDPTIGVEFGVRVVDSNGHLFKLQMWDLSGDLKFVSICRSYYRGSHAVILVYDSTNRETFENLPTWMQDIQQLAREEVTTILLGNKCDLEKQKEVTTEEAEDFAQKFKISRFFETSAKCSINIEEAMAHLIEELKKKYSSEISALLH